MRSFYRSRCINLILMVSTLIFYTMVIAVEAADTATRHLPESQAVLTLKEAARLLRINPAEVVRLATQGHLPGRQIGIHWRFSRAALLDWLTGKNSVPTGIDSPSPDADSKSSIDKKTINSASVLNEGKDEPLPQGTTVAVPELSITPSRELQIAHERAKQPSSNDEKPETIGKKPESSTAEDVFLRGRQVLLKARQLTLELGLFYTKNEQQDLVFLPTGVGVMPVLALGEQDTFISTYTARYGLLNDLQLVINTSLLHERMTTTIRSEERDDTNTKFGDVTLALRNAVIKEGKGYPDVILSVESQIPTGQSSYGLAGSVAFVKSLDPVALFANFRYQHIFSRESSDLSRLQPANIINGTLGYAFALNDSLSLNMAVAGIFTTRTRFLNTVLPARERFILQLGLTSLLLKDLYIEPNLSFALNGPPNVTLGISLPFTFSP